MNRPGARDIAHRAAAAPGASPEHRRFQALLGKTEKARGKLQQWQEQAPLFAQMHAERVKPLETSLIAERRAWAFELEQILLSQRWSKADAATLTRMICDTAGSLIDAGDAPDAELKALHDRHADIDFDTEAQQQLDAMKAMMEATTGIDLGDEPVESADELFARAHAGMAKAQAEFQEHNPPGRSRRKKGPTAAQKQAEQRAEEDRQRISQTVREVYRKLAATLHPDRMPADASEAQRRESTDAMARANTAYAAGDLLALLSLQLQIEQVDVAHAANVAASQVRHFNQVLAEQLAELEAEIDSRQQALCMGFGLFVERRLDPAKLGVLLQEEVRDIEAARFELDRERRMLRAAPAQAKRWLQQVRRQQREDDFFF
jgi:hypothetical protein